VSVGGRFRVAYFALAALFGAAIGAFAVVERAPAPQPPPPWSSWKPSATDPQIQVQQIATHVGAQYHLSRDKKLVNVLVGSPIDPSTTPIFSVAVAKTTHPGDKSSDYRFYDPSTTPMYTLCGDPKLRCAIREGKPSKVRGALVEREAYELALYTLRYVPGARNVVAFFPPPKGQGFSHALFFKSNDVQPELHQPLDRTLRGNPPLPSQLSVRDRRLIAGLTETRMFSVSVGKAKSGTLLILVPSKS
jgi:hypothetical protein